MRTAASHLEHVERADLWAQQLQGVERNVFLSLVADFLSDPKSDVSRLRRTLELLGRGDGGHLERSKSFGEQARIVCSKLPALLDQDGLSEPVLRATLGWTARLLLVKRPPRKDSSRGESTQKASPHGRSAPQSWKLAPTKPLPRRPERPGEPASAAPPRAVPAGPNWRPRLQGLGWGNAAQVIPPLLAELTGEERRDAAREIVIRLDRRELRKRKDKQWVQDLLAAAGEE